MKPTLFIYVFFVSCLISSGLAAATYCVPDNYGTIQAALDNVPADCTISNNTGNFYGGGIHCREHSNPKIINCTISGNHVMNGGGGVYCNDSSHAENKEHHDCS